MPPAPTGNDPSESPPRWPRSTLFLIAFLLLVLFTLWSASRALQSNLIRYDQFKTYLQEDRIEAVHVGQGEIRGSYREGKAPPAAAKGTGQDKTPDNRFRVLRVEDEQLLSQLEQRRVEVSGVEESDSSWVMSLMLYMGLGLVLFMVFTRGMAQAGRGPAGVLSFGKSRGKVFQEDEVDISFNDVAGIPEAKAELEEIIDFLKRPERYKELGARIPKGVLLVGPPGTGKTLLARAVAGEAGVPFISINGSEFVEMFVGVGASRVRDLFEQASKAAPCIVFIDELDAIGRTRSGAAVGGGSNEEREQTLNQLLVELDGFEPHKAVIIMSATNRPEILDPALLRPGRFDRQILVDRPDREGRLAILRVHARGVPLDSETKLEAIAAQTPGFAGAELRNLVNEAALSAARRGAETVSQQDFSHAIDRVVAGLERRSRLISEEERKRTAVHEIGHAITARCSDAGETVQKSSIVPHGLGALGYTRKAPDQDRQLMTESMLRGMLTSLLGGRAAEKLVFGEVSTGAANDLQQATDTARSMVLEYGMSEAVGPLGLHGSTSPFLRQGLAAPADRQGSELVDTIDRETRTLVVAAEENAARILKHNRALLDEMAARLIEAEQLEGPALEALLDRARTPGRPAAA